MSRTLRISLLAGMTALALVATPLGMVGVAQSSREAAGARLLRGAIDLHLHVDPRAPGSGAGGDRADLSTVRLAKARGMRGVLLKDHNEPTAPLAYHFRMEVPGIEIFGGLALNLANGGINVPAVELMAMRIRGEPGRIVWMPVGDSEIEARESKEPNRPFVAVTHNGQVLPDVKRILAIIAEHDLVLASGHIAAEEALLLFREAKSQGVKHLIATHAMDLSGKMTLPQMQKAAKLGAFIEFDMRNVLEGGAHGGDSRAGAAGVLPDGVLDPGLGDERIREPGGDRRLCGGDARERVHGQRARSDVQGESRAGPGAASAVDHGGEEVARYVVRGEAMKSTTTTLMRWCLLGPAVASAAAQAGG